MQDTGLTIYWRDYRITTDANQWILSLKLVATEESLKVSKARHGSKLKTKVGDVSFSEVGYFHKLEQLMGVLIRYETGKMKGEVRLAEFIIMWNEILKDFAEEIEVAVESKMEVAGWNEKGSKLQTVCYG